ncbi:MAG: amino acid racemase [Gemmataceae bacterium]|nr:amino acid racemase [Gemmataceae bacterium]
MIGGIAPGSTVDYYRLLIAEYREHVRDGSYPSVLINSIDLKRMLDLVGENRLADLTAYLVREVHRLARAGADFGLIASNTPHIVFDEVAQESPIPLLSIVEAAGEVAHESGLRTVGLLGTRYTMEGGFYPEAFARYGMTVIPPRTDDRRFVHEKYMRELVLGEFRSETREEFAAIIHRLQQDGAEAVLLAGTELPLLLRDEVNRGIPHLDTTRIHVRRAIAELLSPTPGSDE